MNIDPHSYNITIRRDTFDDDVLFEARVKELPDLIEYGESYDEVYDLAVDAIETAAKAFAERGRPFPSALTPVDDYSGRVTLRLPGSLHRSLSQAADGEGISLNQYLVNILSYYSGFAAAHNFEGRIPWFSIPQKSKRKAAHGSARLTLVRTDQHTASTG